MPQSEILEHGRLMVKSRQFVRRMVLLASSLLLVTTLQFLPAMGFQRTTDTQTWVEHTLRVLNASQYLLLAVKDAQNDERGYLLTGDQHYPQAFQSALSNESQAQLDLRQLTIDNPRQQRRIAKLNKALEINRAALTRVITLYGTEGPKAAATAVGNGEGSRGMLQIWDLISEIQQEERQLLEIRSNAAQAQATYLKWTLRAAGFFLIVLLAVLGAVSELDIRDHKHAEESIKRSEEQFHTLANAIPHLCWIANGDGGIFWYNQRWYEFTGTTLEDVRGSGWQSVLDVKLLPHIMQEWNRSIEVGEPFEMIFPLRAANGVFHPFLTRVMPLCGESGKVARWFGTNTDITDQRMTENALRGNQERLQLALEVAQIGTFEWNLQTGAKQRTPELEAMYGLQPVESPAAEKTWLDLTCPDDQEEVRRHMAEAMVTGSFEAEWRVIWPKGEEHWHFGRARVLKDDAGKPLRVIGAIVDVTARKRAELEILQINAGLEARVRDRTGELVAANKELAAFAYSVSHDLRAPLRGIDGWSLALLEDYGAQLDAGAHKYLNRVRDETQRMGRLIDDMLRLSRVARDEMKLDTVDLTALANAITGTLRDEQPERSLEFVIEPELVAAGDKRLLELALTNLFSNAVKFTGKRNNAVIEFGRIEKEGMTAFFVRDNGAGFDMAHAGKIFGAFQRFHSFADFPGTGIGLAIVRRVVARHGGRAWAEAQVGVGATFWFTLNSQSEESSQSTLELAGALGGTINSAPVLRDSLKSVQL
jgi:PAS domain S-box-containing protein